uniref:P2Y purinoceptor 1-like n=1 Tax=Geotrypetes seraphini TaxID=260995 RepID=A0A6P8SFD8_GEOSA|nr:P2Y purinoceptor 1-like [Geotrypetes seraphini]
MEGQPPELKPAPCIIHYSFYNDSFTFSQDSIHGKLANETCTTFLCRNHVKRRWYCYILIFTCILALTIGFVGNIAVLLKYVFWKKSWTNSIIFLFNLALCDLTWILTVPISVAFNLQKLGLHSAQKFCWIKKIFLNINIYGSIFFLMLISFDRYVGSVHPLSSLKWWDKRKAIFCTIAIWIFLLIEAIPDFYYTIATHRSDKILICLDNIQGPLDYVIPIILCRTILGFIVPFTIIFTCYVLMLNVLRKLKKHRHRKNRIVKPLMLVSASVLVFTISFAPYHVMMMVLLFYRINYLINPENISLMYAIYEFTETICSISSCLDFVLFIFASNKACDKLKVMKCSSRSPCHCCQSWKVEDITILLEARQN